MAVKRRIAQVDEEFATLLRELKIERIKIGTDKIPTSERRLSKAIARQVRTNLNDYMTLVKAKLEDDKSHGGRK